MSCGLVPVSTDVGDSARLVGDTGFVVPPRSPERIVAALDEISALAPAERARQSAAARERIVAEFGVDRMVARYDSLYRQALAR
jgi:glycosyltransferase involved in cell wall biosynthesis